MGGRVREPERERVGRVGGESWRGYRVTKCLAHLCAVSRQTCPRLSASPLLLPPPPPPPQGLDPASRQNLWSVVKAAKRERGIILTTHSMEEATVLCDRLGIFVDGTLVCIGNPKVQRRGAAAATSDGHCRICSTGKPRCLRCP